MRIKTQYWQPDVTFLCPVPSVTGLERHLWQRLGLSDPGLQLSHYALELNNFNSWFYSCSNSNYFEAPPFPILSPFLFKMPKVVSVLCTEPWQQPWIENALVFDFLLCPDRHIKSHTEIESNLSHLELTVIMSQDSCGVGSQGVPNLGNESCHGLSFSLKAALGKDVLLLIKSDHPGNYSLCPHHHTTLAFSDH